MEKDLTILMEALDLKMKYQREARALHNDAQVAMAGIRHEAGKKKPIEDEPVCESPAPDGWRPDAGFWVGATWVAAGVGILMAEFWTWILSGTVSSPQIIGSAFVSMALIFLVAPHATETRREYDKSKKGGKP